MPLGWVQSHQSGRVHGMKERASAASPHMLDWTEEAMERLTQVTRAPVEGDSSGKWTTSSPGLVSCTSMVKSPVVVLAARLGLHRTRESLNSCLCFL
jgi:hypothetical protein